MRRETTDRMVRLAGEFLVIVVGVLTALGVDQIMESRGERVLERQLLESLIEDVQLDSADFASLPILALRRARGAEIILREFAPGTVRVARVRGQLEDLGPYPADLTDSELVAAFGAIGRASDLDVASGAYGEFSGAGGQRLVRNQSLRRAIHKYYSSVQSNLKYDPRVMDGMSDFQRRSGDLGLALGDDDASVLRNRLGVADPSYFASLRRLQQEAIVQSDIAEVLLAEAMTLLETLRAELGSGGHDRAPDR